VRALAWKIVRKWFFSPPVRWTLCISREKGGADVDASP